MIENSGREIRHHMFWPHIQNLYSNMCMWQGDKSQRGTTHRNEGNGAKRGRSDRRVIRGEATRNI